MRADMLIDMCRHVHGHVCGHADRHVQTCAWTCVRTCAHARAPACAGLLYRHRRRLYIGTADGSISAPLYIGTADGSISAPLYTGTADGSIPAPLYLGTADGPIPAPPMALYRHRRRLYIDHRGRLYIDHRRRHGLLREYGRRWTPESTASASAFQPLYEAQRGSICISIATCLYRCGPTRKGVGELTMSSITM